jgi:putative ABC transport system ATP-binding protein
MPIVINAFQLQKAYRTGPTTTPVLREVSLSIERGECVFLVGPSGSGKTTLLSILGCILSPDAGMLELLGQDVSRLKPRHKARFRREKLGFVFQRFHLFDGLRAWENVAVSLQLLGQSGRSAKRKSLELLERVGLADRVNYHISQLSMGQRQRVALARALVADPELILADEPTASLDAESGQTAMRLLKDLSQDMGKTVLVVTHDSRIFPMADRILTLSEGRLLTPSHASANSVSSKTLAGSFLPQVTS